MTEVKHFEVIGYTHYVLSESNRKRLDLPTSLTGGIFIGGKWRYSPVDLSVIAADIVLFNAASEYISDNNCRTFNRFSTGKVLSFSSVSIVYAYEGIVISKTIQEIKNLGIGHLFRQYAPLSFLHNVSPNIRR